MKRRNSRAVRRVKQRLVRHVADQRLGRDRLALQVVTADDRAAEVGCSRPVSILIVVVLPAPFGRNRRSRRGRYPA
jgi:hypothetical protein